MELTSLNQLGEWNPQLFRELKGLLKPRNLLVTVTGSLLGQFIILMTFSQHRCLGPADNICTELGWDIQWQFVFRVLNWILPFLLLVSGVYSIISDLGKEARRGTLNFIRLSPQSSQSILTGKILGVPALLYVGIALTIPLHLGSALAAGVPLFWNLGIYTLWGIGCCLFYSAACFYTLQWNSPQYEPKTLAGAGSIIALLLGLPYISVIDFSWDWYHSGSGLGSWKWFLLPIARQPELAYLWTLITLGVVTYWIWQAANRLFRNPSATLLTKRQSYWLVGSFQVWLLGFVLPELNSVPSPAQGFIGFGVLFVLNPLWFLALNSALSPNRQALQDWVRYQRKSRSTTKGLLNRSLIGDLIRGEKSPALGAIAINLLITAAIWIPWILLGTQEVEYENFTTQSAFLGLLLTLNLILIYAALAQLMLFMKQWQQTLWASSLMGGVVVLLIGVWSVLKIEPLQMPFLWLFSPLPVLTLVHASTTTIFVGLLAQLGVLGLLTLQLTRQLQKAGESTSKALFVGHSSSDIKK